MATVEKLLLQLEARMTSYERALKKAQGDTDRSLRAIESRFDKTAGKIAAFGRGFAGALGVGLGIGGLVTAAQRALALADELGETSDQLGITTDDLQALRFGAHEAGVEVGSLDSALNVLSRSIGEAATGDKTKIAQFEALGVSLKDAAGNARPLSDVLQDVARKIINLGDRQEQTAALNDLFGRSGVRLLPLLEQISGGMGDLTEAAREAGQVMSEETVKSLGEAHDAIERLQVRIVIATGTIINAIGGMPTALADAAQEMAKQAEKTGVTMGNALIDAAMKTAGLTSPAELKAALTGRFNEAAGMFGAASQSNVKLLPPSTSTYRPITGTSSGANAAQKANEARDEALRQMAEEIQLNAELIARYAEGKVVLDGLRAAYDALNEAKKLGLEGDERETFLAGKVQQEFQRQQLALLEEGATLTESLRTKEEERAAALEHLGKLLDAGAISQTTYNEQLKRTSEEYERQQALIDELQSFGEQAFDRIGSAITEAFTKGEGAAIDFLSIAKGVLAELLQEMIKLAILNPLKNLFRTDGNLLPTIADAIGAVGSIFGPSTPTLPSGGVHGTLIPKMAGGGSVSAGNPYVVGEHRPELFIPNVSGRIVPRVPNGGGTSITIINRHGEAQVDATKREQGGRERIDITVDRIVAEKLERPGTMSNRALSRMGLRRPPTKR